MPGRRIKVTTSSTPPQTFEGTLFTACPILNVVAINTALNAKPAANTPGDYRIVPISAISNVQVVSLAEQTPGKTGWAHAQPPIGKVDTAKLREREEQRIRKLKADESKRGRGVTAEAQALFNAMDRM